MSNFITEDWLRANYSLSDGTEIRLPADCKLTPAARGLITDHHLVVKFHDEQGRLFVESIEDRPTNNDSTYQPKLKQVHGLTSQQGHVAAECQLCHQAVAKKPDTLTHLNAHTLVSKSDPRLAFRAKLDSCIAMAVWLQIEVTAEPQIWLADIRSVLGNIMRADVLNETLTDFMIAGLDEKAIHKLSHQPLKYIGHDHIVPAVEHGRNACLLNLLRTEIRETETSAASIFIDRDLVVSRPDLMQGLNRLSSAVYVLMLLCVLHETGKEWPTTEMLRAKLGAQ
ncbi:ethanolamine utilization cob(I)yrinic acid a,c-diamide adenosyltransferase EutT [Entomomonas asaccharolytica]|uniref:Ethanolamine utilization cob(I)yrinic acid a,c-diamide adenosyltransferase EutT n=1 Tax=Entomomonas asaccharolytica TaxID=2785331 RepID=A0A974NHN7_9GAMM|nr:ethanolamine utilization cob(I)yrinic acid a,c-diamide adenosyltransferase EutT [Entomomonas asaccharolytica]QQP86738.1 ethanolamine utilization cob(I)yrinic acid a,c-diamide adenosyltransferase EutT [Entomomonas asaccharolytica]